MKSFAVWFRDFFLYSFSLGGGVNDLFGLKLDGGFSADRESLVELRKFSTRLSWLFGSVLYLSGFAFCCWILALSAMHLTAVFKNATIAERIFFFASPNAWKKYLLPAGGLFNAFRLSKDRGEYIFIFLSIVLILSSLLSLVFSLVTIHIASGKNLKELRWVSLSLCFPVFGWLVACFLIFHFFFVSSKERIQRWAKKKRLLAFLFKSYFDLLEKREQSKQRFKPKKIDFLELKKKEEKLPKFLGEIDRYVVKKI